MRRGGPLSLVALIGLLGTLGYLNWLAINNDIETSPVVPVQSGASSSPGTQTPIEDPVSTLSDLKETMARPLFNTTRRPAGPATVEQREPEPPAQPPPAPALSPPEHLQLIGTMRNGPKQARALIRVENAPAAAWFDVGAEIGGWRLSEVADDHVVVESGGRRSQITLHSDKNAIPAPR